LDKIDRQLAPNLTIQYLAHSDLSTGNWITISPAMRNKSMAFASLKCRSGPVSQTTIRLALFAPFCSNAQATSSIWYFSAKARSTASFGPNEWFHQCQQQTDL